ncbi:hypothetical protein Tco_1219583 [Tanacetum coccineum]
MSNHILHVHPTASTSSSIPDLQHQSYLKMKDDEQAREANLPIWLSLKIKFKKHVPLVELFKVDVVRTHDHEDHHDDDAPLRGGSSAKRQNTSEHGTFTTSESTSSQAMNESTFSSLGTQEQIEDFDAWKDDQGIDDDEVPFEEVSPELLDEVSVKVMTNDLQRMQNALTILWESKVEDLTLQILKKPTPVFQSCVRNLKNPPMSLVNQYLFYLKNGNSEARKYVLSLHKIHTFPFTETNYMYLHKNDIEDMYRMCINGKIKDSREIGLL